MDPESLRALLNVQTLTLDELQAKDPALASKLLAEVRSQEKTQIEAALPQARSDLRTRVGAIDFTNARVSLVDHITTELRAPTRPIQISPTSRGEYSWCAPLRTDQVLATNATVGKQLALARVHEVNTLAGLSPAATTAILAAAPAVGSLDDTTLSKLVADQKLSQAEATQLGLAATIYQLTEDNTSLSAAIRAPRSRYWGAARRRIRATSRPSRTLTARLLARPHRSEATA